jgi:transposase-like protein
LTLPFMLWELSVAEQRYRAVLEAAAGISVAEVAQRYGVSRQSVHTWLVRYRQEGIAGLEDRSHQVHHHPWRLPAGIEKRSVSCAGRTQSGGRAGWCSRWAAAATR